MPTVWGEPDDREGFFDLMWSAMPIFVLVAVLALAQGVFATIVRPDVLVIGDSLTAGWGATDGRGFAQQLGAVVDGRPGQASAAFAEIAPDARTVVIELGINDWAQEVAPATFGENIRELVSRAKADRVVLVIAYRIGGERSGSWDAYADEVLAVVDPRVSVVDLRAAFGGPSTVLLDPDLVHPNDAGHALIARLVATAIR